MLTKILFLFFLITSSTLALTQVETFHSLKISSMKNNIFVLALNGSECNCNENSLKLVEILKDFKKDSLEVIIVTNDLTKNRAKSTLQYVYELDQDLFDGYNIIGSKRLFEKLSDGTSSQLNVIHKGSVLFSKAISLIDLNELKKFKHTYGLNNYKKFKLSKNIKQKLFFVGNNIYALSDSALIIQNNFYNTFFKINLDENNATKLLNEQKQSDIMNWILPLISEDLPIEQFKSDLGSTGKQFFNINNVSKTNKQIFTLGNLTNPYTTYLSEWFENDILYSSDSSGNIDAVYNIHPPKPIGHEQVYLFSPFSNPIFSTDNNGYFYFTISITKQSGNVDTTDYSQAEYPFVARYKIENNHDLVFDRYLNLNLPDYYINTNLFYYNNFVGFFEYQGMSYLYFKHLPYLYNLSEENVVKIEDLPYDKLDLRRGVKKQVKPYKIQSVSETINKDIALVVEKKFKNRLIIINPSSGKQIANFNLKKIKGNTGCYIDLNSVYCLITPVMRKYSYYKLNYMKD